MTSSEAETEILPPEPSNRYSRRLMWLAAFIVLLFGGYSAGWFVIADRVEKGIDENFAEMKAEDGVTASCDNRKISGFPFRFELFCDRIAFDDPNAQVNFEAGALRSARQIYDLKHTVGELDGPLTITAPLDLTLNWSALRASVREAKPFPERISIVADALKGTDGTTPLFSADKAEAHTRSNGADIDIASLFTNLTIDPATVDGRAIPPLSGALDASITGGVALADAEPLSLRGQSGQVRVLELSINGGRLQVKGPISFDAEGLANGQLNVAIENPAAISQALQTAIPEQASNIKTAFQALTLMGAQPSLPLTIQQGVARLGFIPLGQLPAVD